MRSTFVILLIVLSAFTACKKTNSTNYWHYDNTYNTVLTTRDFNGLYLIGANDEYRHVIEFYFLQFPVTSGNYKIVDTPRSAMEMSIYAVGVGDPDYHSTGIIPASANIKIVNGKVSISMTNVCISQVKNPADSIKLTTAITEK